MSENDYMRSVAMFVLSLPAFLEIFPSLELTNKMADFNIIT